MRLPLLLLASLTLACGDKEPAGGGADTAATADPDADGDGFPASVDCDDEAPFVFPGADEVCDGADNDCDGTVDEDDAVDAETFYVDSDGDGAGDPTQPLEACAEPPGAVTTGDDCDDDDAGASPAQPELCDGIDNDCDGTVDEDDAADATTWHLDEDGDGHGGASTVVACAAPAGALADQTDCDDADPTAAPDLDEVCDGVDNDCDGTVDEDDAIDAPTWHLDYDADGFGDATAPAVACAAPASHVADGTDCDDTEAAVSPAAAEVCDEVDNDCDGAVDEDDATDAPTWYLDYDGDGYGADRITAVACAAPSSYVETDTDCDDLDAGSHPGATEVCDDADNDCDGAVDVGAVDATTWYTDADGDGFGDATTAAQTCDAIPSGGVTDATDCDDTDDSVAPDALEYCDSVDNDCDGAVDEDDAEDADTWYADTDGDGYGDPDSTTTACSQPSGYVIDDGDCDDSDSAVTECSRCTLTGVGAPSTLVSSGNTHGVWMTDPLETLGAGLIWEINGYNNVTTVTEFASQADMVARNSSGSFTLPLGAEGTGHQVYDGVLYYTKTSSSTLVQYDIASGAQLATLTLSDAGSHNTYAYQWGGYSDIDFAADEQGLWVIYGSVSRSGEMAVAALDPATFTVTDTYYTGTSKRTGNAFLICGVLYDISSYSSSSATLDFAYDTADGSTWNPGISFPNPHGYNASTDYDPGDGNLRTWDSSRRVIWSTTTN